MRRILFVAIICMFTAMPSLADFHGDGYSGGTANYTRLDGYYYGDGGEFTLYGINDNEGHNFLTLSNSAYVSSTSDLEGYSGSFQTFCLERDEYAGSASVQVSTQNAALTGFGSHAYMGGENTNFGDDLDPRTAYLYYKFATGKLSGYDYDGAGRSNSAKKLQKAIWYIENEYPFWTPIENSQVDKWIDEAQDAIDDKIWVGIGNVRVLQMMYISAAAGCFYDGYKQDFLYVEPVPVPGAILLGMLGMAVAGIKLRKFA